jgi:hypothetical protein
VQDGAEIACCIYGFEPQVDYDVVRVVAGLKHFGPLDAGLLACRRKPVESLEPRRQIADLVLDVQYGYA